MHAVLDFLRDNFPPWRTIAVGGPIALAWTFTCLAFAGWLKRSRRWKTAYTRKTFHILTFSTAALCLAIPGWGMPTLCLFGGMASLVILYALLVGPGNLLYEAVAREADAPRRSWYIIIPYLTTLAGGLASAILFAPAAIAGFLVTGLADAVAEPIGARFGRRRYRVLKLTRGGPPSYRSLEGSLAVFLAGIICIVVAAAISPALRWSPALIYLAPLIALCCAVAEAASPHGWDNLTLQLLPAGLCALWLT